MHEHRFLKINLMLEFYIKVQYKPETGIFNKNVLIFNKIQKDFLIFTIFFIKNKLNRF